MPITQKGITKLLKHHKLDAEENTDGDVNDAIQNSVSQGDMDEMENRKKELEKENKDLKNRAEAGDRAAEALVDQTLEKYKNRIGDNADTLKFYRDGLINNREATTKALDGLPEPTTAQPANPNAGKEPIHNRGTAKTPEAIEKTADADSAAATKASALIKNRAEKLEANGVPPATAWIRADTEIKSEIAAGLHK